MVAAGSAAGAFGALLGLGGGVLIVPILTLGFGLPLREAVGVSLVCVIMTSSAAAGVYLERHVANLRLGMTLELFTAIGALVGGSIAFLLDERSSRFLFAILLVYVAVSMLRAGATAPPSPARRGRLAQAAGHPHVACADAAPRDGRTPLDRGATPPGRPLRSGLSGAQPRPGVVGAPAPVWSRRCSASVAGSSRCR